jgi:hypothetical protein
MGELALSVIAGPVIGSIVQNVLGTQSGGAQGSGGPFDSLLKGLTSAFEGLFQNISPNTSAVPTEPSPYSTANMSSSVVNDPGPYIRPAMSRIEDAYTQSATVRDHRHGAGEGGIEVRDHRHPDGGWENTLPGPTVGGLGTDRDADEFATLSNAQSFAEGKEQDMLNDPTNVAKQNEYTKAQQALQNLFSVIQEQNKERAQMEKEAAQSARLT